MDDEVEPAATTAAAVAIKPINKDTVHRICSGQVVLNLGVAVKELVENAIDAGATLVEVRLRDQGLESVEVVDNGSGVAESNFIGLTAKYNTSKIREFSDLAGVTTFGFRGEALSSLCALSDMIVTTRHASVECGTRLELDHRGEIRNKSPCARSLGTTIMLTNIFATLPVRKREFVKNIRKEFTQMCQIMQGYCLIAKSVRIICTNTSKKGVKSTLMATRGAQSYIENISAIFGPKQRSDLVELRMETDDHHDDADRQRFRLEGWISSCSHGSGRSTKDRQFFYVNSRPCEPKQIIKGVNEMYHKYNVNQSPFVFLNVVIDSQQVDVNLTPDKRQVLVNNEKILIEVLKATLVNTFGVIPSTFSMQNVNLTQETNDTTIESTDDEAFAATGGDLLRPHAKTFSRMLSQWKATGQTDESAQSPKPSQKRKADAEEIAVRNSKMRSIQEFLTQKESNTKHFETPDDETSDVEFQTVCAVVESKSDELPLQTFKINSDQIHSPTLKTKKNSKLQTFQVTSNQLESLAIKTQKYIDPPVRCQTDSDDEVTILDSGSQDTSCFAPQAALIIDTTIDQIQSLMLRESDAARRASDTRTKSLERLRFKATIDPSKNKVAEHELQTEIHKSDFRRMHIIGQFNVGFIVTRLDDDLFIIDQHASDEKYHFETLQQCTELQHQPMVQPQALHLTAVDEMVLIDNRKVFEMNGFRFDIDESAEATKRVRLVGKPFSKNWEFGKEDIDELLFMLHEGGSNHVCRPSRIRSMFASRACRKSVMIGTALPNHKMRQLVDQISEIDHPWNCPHGRPTMRHLINIAMLDDVTTPLSASVSDNSMLSSSLSATCL